MKKEGMCGKNIKEDKKKDVWGGSEGERKVI